MKSAKKGIYLLSTMVILMVLSLIPKMESRAEDINPAKVYVSGEDPVDITEPGTYTIGDGTITLAENGVYTLTNVSLKEFELQEMEPATTIRFEGDNVFDGTAVAGIRAWCDLTLEGDRDESTVSFNNIKEDSSTVIHGIYLTDADLTINGGQYYFNFTHKEGLEDSTYGIEVEHGNITINEDSYLEFDFGTNAGWEDSDPAVNIYSPYGMWIVQSSGNVGGNLTNKGGELEFLADGAEDVIGIQADCSVTNTAGKMTFDYNNLKKDSSSIITAKLSISGGEIDIKSDANSHGMAIDGIHDTADTGLSIDISGGVLNINTPKNGEEVAIDEMKKFNITGGTVTIVNEVGAFWAKDFHISNADVSIKGGGPAFRTEKFSTDYPFIWACNDGDNYEQFMPSYVTDQNYSEKYFKSVISNYPGASLSVLKADGTPAELDKDYYRSVSGIEIFTDGLTVKGDPAKQERINIYSDDKGISNLTIKDVNLSQEYACLYINTAKDLSLTFDGKCTFAGGIELYAREEKDVTIKGNADVSVTTQTGAEGIFTISDLYIGGNINISGTSGECFLDSSKSLTIADNVSIDAKSNGALTTIWATDNLVINTTGSIKAENNNSGTALGTERFLTLKNGLVYAKGNCDYEGYICGALEIYKDDAIILENGIGMFGSEDIDADYEDAEDPVVCNFNSAREIGTGFVGDNPAKTVVFAKNFKLTFNTNGAAAIAGKTVRADKLPVLPANPTRNRATFTGWFTDAACTQKFDATKLLTKDTVLYAGWEGYKHKINYVLNGGKNSSSNPATFDELKGLTGFAAPTRKNYKFEGWYKDAAFKEKITSIPANTLTDVTVYAKWTLAYKITDAQYKENTIALDMKLNGSFNKSKLSVSFGRVADASGYEVYAYYANKSDSRKLEKTVKQSSKKTITTTLSKLKSKAIETKNIVRIQVKAYKKVGSEKVYIGASKVINVAGPKNKYTNVKSIKLNADSVTLKKGKTFKLKATLAKEKSSKPYLASKYGYKIRFFSYDSSIAKVDKTSGKITAKKKGSTYVYAIAQSGKAVKVKVTVK